MCVVKSAAHKGCDDSISAFLALRPRFFPPTPRLGSGGGRVDAGRYGVSGVALVSLSPDTQAPISLHSHPLFRASCGSIGERFTL